MRKRLLASIFLIALFFAVQPVMAQVDTGLELTGVTAYGPGEIMTTKRLAANIIRAAIGLVGVIFLILAIYAGFLWMTAAGAEEKVTKAKKVLTSAVIGIILVTLAYAITSWILTKIAV